MGYVVFFPQIQATTCQTVMYIFHVYILLVQEMCRNEALKFFPTEAKAASEEAASDMNTWWYLVGCCKPGGKNLQTFLVTFWISLPSSDFRFRSNGQLTSVHHWRLGLSGVDRQRNLV